MRTTLTLAALFLSLIVHAQTYEIDVYDGQTVTTCSGTFTDSNPSTTGNYGNNEDYTITFCSGSSDYLTFDFDVTGFYDPLSSGDTLYMYDGTSTSGDLIMQIDGTDDPSFSEFMLSTLSTCVTFRFTSDGSTNNDGWAAKISCPAAPSACNGNEPAADIMLQAPYICNLDGYCGSTSSYYHEDLPYNMIGTGGNCPSSQAFLGTVQNNSWLRFEATTANVSMDFTVSGCGTDGIQVGILQYDGSNWVRYSDCSTTDGGNNGTFTLTGTGLIPGEIYYIMADGNAGANCDYTISVDGSSGFALVDAGADQTVCAGDPVNLSATGPAGATYTWKSLDGVVSGVTGANQTFNPIVATTYVVEVTGGDVCKNQTDTVVVDMCGAVLPVELVDFSATCEPQHMQLDWRTASETNNDYFILERAGEEGHFQLLATVAGAGTSNSISNYRFLDTQTTEGNVYYRLWQVDFNGEKTLKATINGKQNCQEATASVTGSFYNSYSKEIVLNYSSNQLAAVPFQLFDVSGRLLVNKNLTFTPHGHQVRVSAANLMPGSMYIINVQLPKHYSEKLIVR